MTDDEKQRNRPEEERPQEMENLEKTAADQVRDVRDTRLGQEAKTVWRPGVISQPIVDPFENPGSGPQPEPSKPGSGTSDSGGQSETPGEGGGSESTEAESSKE